MSLAFVKRESYSRFSSLSTNWSQSTTWCRKPTGGRSIICTFGGGWSWNCRESNPFRGSSLCWQKCFMAVLSWSSLLSFFFTFFHASSYLQAEPIFLHQSLVCNAWCLIWMRWLWYVRCVCGVRCMCMRCMLCAKGLWTLCCKSCCCAQEFPSLSAKMMLYIRRKKLLSKHIWQRFGNLIIKWNSPINVESEGSPTTDLKQNFGTEQRLS